MTRSPACGRAFPARAVGSLGRSAGNALPAIGATRLDPATHLSDELSLSAISCRWAICLRDISQATTGVKDLERTLRRSQEHPNLEIEPALHVVGVTFVVVVAGVHPTTAIVATPNFVNHVTSSRSASTSSSGRIAWAIAMARRQSDERYSRVRAVAGGASRVEGEAGTGTGIFRWPPSPSARPRRMADRAVRRGSPDHSLAELQSGGS
jgi:hypothetical protein